MDDKNPAQEPSARTGIGWKQYWWPGPERVFSDEELARAGQQPWPRGLDLYLGSTVLILALATLRLMPAALAWFILIGTAAFVWHALAFARELWKRPHRDRLNRIGYTAGLVPGLLLGGGFAIARSQGVPKDAFVAPLMLFSLLILLSYFGWLVVIMLRSQQIEARLRELDEQERSIRLARRLATAQIQPHFLFNTLASVQHWVDTRDERAGPTLQSFTRYLRATLPMFERETLTLAEELQIVRSYLEVMQARLGERLTWQIEAEPGLMSAIVLPPGALLTLVENAIAHGIEPALHGGRIDVRVCVQGALQLLDVVNDGAEPSPACVDGLGLANTRERLRQQFGERASLSLTPLACGCRARIEIRP